MNSIVSLTNVMLLVGYIPKIDMLPMPKAQGQGHSDGTKVKKKGGRQNPFYRLHIHDPDYFAWCSRMGIL
jgi:hypothetical protein